MARCVIGNALATGHTARHRWPWAGHHCCFSFPGRSQGRQSVTVAAAAAPKLILPELGPSEIFVTITTTYLFPSFPPPSQKDCFLCCTPPRHRLPRRAQIPQNHTSTFCSLSSCHPAPPSSDSIVSTLASFNADHRPPQWRTLTSLRRLLPTAVPSRRQIRVVWCVEACWALTLGGHEG